MGILGENTGVGWHFLLQGIFSTQGLNPHLLRWQADSLPLSRQGAQTIVRCHGCSAAKSCPALCDPMHCSPPASVIHGIFQVRILSYIFAFCSPGILSSLLLHTSSLPGQNINFNHSLEYVLYIVAMFYILQTIFIINFLYFDKVKFSAINFKDNWAEVFRHLLFSSLIFISYHIF